jgi:hypothetical protein
VLLCFFVVLQVTGVAEEKRRRSQFRAAAFPVAREPTRR